MGLPPTKLQEALSIEQGLAQIPDDVLGHLLKEYVVESGHQSGVTWTGFTYSENAGIRKFLRDLITYVENAK